MERTRHEAFIKTRDDAFDTLTRTLHGPQSRRKVVRLLAAMLATSVFGIRRRAAAAKGTSIPPNCIYVCCDGTCDSWKMCMRCVKWPTPTTTTSVAAQ